MRVLLFACVTLLLAAVASGQGTTYVNPGYCPVPKRPNLEYKNKPGTTWYTFSCSNGFKVSNDNVNLECQGGFWVNSVGGFIETHQLPSCDAAVKTTVAAKVATTAAAEKGGCVVPKRPNLSYQNKPGSTTYTFTCSNGVKLDDDLAMLACIKGVWYTMDAIVLNKYQLPSCGAGEKTTMAAKVATTAAAEKAGEKTTMAAKVATTAAAEKVGEKTTMAAKIATTAAAGKVSETVVNFANEVMEVSVAMQAATKGKISDHSFTVTPVSMCRREGLVEMTQRAEEMADELLAKMNSKRTENLTIKKSTGGCAGNLVYDRLFYIAQVIKASTQK